MARILKICWAPWQNASRDKRELSVYRDMGHEVIVMASGEPKDRGTPDTVESFSVKRYGVEPFGKKAPIKVNQILSLLNWSRYVCDFKPDIISGHDFTGWIVGWLAFLFRKNRPLFIYDAHEFELGRNTKRNKIRTALIRNLERFIIKHSEFSIMVNDSIADEVQKEYRLQRRPIVVRSTPNYWKIDPDVCAKQREAFLKEFNSLGI